MVSHKKYAGFDITVGKEGIRFKKRPSMYNECIAARLKGHKFATSEVCQRAFAEPAKEAAEEIEMKKKN